MKKKISIILTVLLSVAFCFACTSDSLEGTYKDYDIEGDLLSIYFSMTLKNSKYQFDEVTVKNGNKSTVTKSKGSYSASDNKITFTDSNGTTFSGTVSNGVLEFSFSHIKYAMKK